MVECVPSQAAQRPSLQQQDTQSPPSVTQAQTQTQSASAGSSSSKRNRAGSRGVEVSDSSSLLSCELIGSAQGKNSLQKTLNRPFVDSGSNSQLDVLSDADKNAYLLHEDFFDEQSRVEAGGKTGSCAYPISPGDFPSTSAGENGQTPFTFPEPLPFREPSRVNHRTGAKERLFLCSYCGKAFNRPKKVEIHQRVHTGEKPYSCSTCGKTFSEAGNLRKHQRIHSGEKPYSCGMCGRGFAWIRNLKAHQLRSHPEVYTEETAGGAQELPSFT